MESENKEGAGGHPGGVPDTKHDPGKRFVSAVKESVEEFLPKGIKPFYRLAIDRIDRTQGRTKFFIFGLLIAIASAWGMHKWDSTKIAEIEQDKHKQDITIQDLKADLNRLTTEKNGAESKLAMRETLDLQYPAFITNLSYFLATQPTNQQQLSQFRITLEGFTNSLADAALMPTFDL